MLKRMLEELDQAKVETGEENKYSDTVILDMLDPYLTSVTHVKTVLKQCTTFA